MQLQSTLAQYPASSQVLKEVVLFLSVHQLWHLPNCAEGQLNLLTGSLGLQVEVAVCTDLSARANMKKGALNSWGTIQLFSRAAEFLYCLNCITYCTLKSQDVPASVGGNL